ncbi:MAG: hypothetical protein N3A61_00770, partial [Ignavibacteria bacterium]|nr:hypothetical protein [Ignavibacteria bacterium]
RFIHPFFSAYINSKHFSIFPLFPWLAFMLVGGMTSLMYLDFVSKNKENEFMKRLFFAGLILIAIGFIFSYIPIDFKYYSKSLRPNPFFFLLRLGIVLSLLSTCWYYAMKRQTEKSFVIDSSRESLFIYVCHLQIIFAAFYNNKSLSDLLKNSFGVIECIVATLILITAMVFAAKGWSWLKNRSMKSARFAMLALVVFLLIVFFTKDTWLEKYYPF